MSGQRSGAVVAIMAGDPIAAGGGWSNDLDRWSAAL
jgi:hypothetical protein